MRGEGVEGNGIPVGVRTKGGGGACQLHVNKREVLAEANFHHQIAGTVPIEWGLQGDGVGPNGRDVQIIKHFL